MSYNLTIRFPAESKARLDSLIQSTEADGATEVIANALRLYEAMIQDTKAGKRWIVKLPDGSLQPFSPWQ